MVFSENTEEWWGGEGRSRDRLTILDLIGNNTLDAETAGLLWLLAERGASIIVGAAPRKAGKTTLLTSIVDLVPPTYERVFTRGRDEDCSFLQRTDPSKTYILVPELSDHTPAYLWGDAAKTVFQSLDDGYSLAAAIHADTPEEVIGMLDGYPLYLSHDVLTNIDVIVNLRMFSGANGVERRVNNVTLVDPGLEFATVVEWNAEEDTFRRQDSGPALEAMSAHTGIDRVEDAVTARASLLESWLKLAPAKLQDLVRNYYASGCGPSPT